MEEEEEEEKQERFTAFRETPSMRTSTARPNHITPEKFYLWLMEFA